MKKTKQRNQKSKKARTKKTGPGKIDMKALKRNLKGFYLTWASEDPLGDYYEPLKVKVGHNNPITSLRIVDDRYWRCFSAVADVTRVKWRITINMEFRKDGKTEIKPREIIAVGTLKPKVDEEATYKNLIKHGFKGERLAKAFTILRLNPAQWNDDSKLFVELILSNNNLGLDDLVVTEESVDEYFQATIEDMFKDAQEKNYFDQYQRCHILQEIISYSEEITEADRRGEYIRMPSENH